MNYINVANDLLTNIAYMGYFVLAGPGIVYAIAGFGGAFFIFLIIPNNESK